MILLRKTDSPPAVLRSQGAEETQANCALVDADPEAYRTGEESVAIKKRIYGHRTVKKALLRGQSSKCCYCEAGFRATSYGDIEHFRPKGFSQQCDSNPKEYPGYYWLAYDWNNLYLSCEVCNRGYKKNIFPLKNPSSRAHSPCDCLERELPLLIDPGGQEDPRNHIRFRREAPEARTQIGGITIHCLGLRRGNLNELRMQRLREIEGSFNVWRMFHKDARRCAKTLANQGIELIEDAIKPTAPFSAMARDFFEAENVLDAQGNWKIDFLEQ